MNWLNLGRELLRSLIVEAIINECDKSNALRERYVNCDCTYFELDLSLRVRETFRCAEL